MKFILIIFILWTIIDTSFQQQKVGCPISDNPSQVFQCLTLNPQAFVDLISKNDFKSFCHMANGYMTCMSTYIRDCLGGKAASGILEELQDLNLKCCISGKTDECVIKNPRLLENCFSSDNYATLDNGNKKPIMDVQLGDTVKAIDSKGQLIDTEVISILHKETNKQAMFQVLSDINENKISLTNRHMIQVKNKGYVHAYTIKVGDILRIFSKSQSKFIDFQVTTKKFELKTGYTAPMTNEGTILVNNIDTSCYAVINSQNLANFGMLPFRLWYKISKYLGPNNQIPDIIDIEYYSQFLYSFATNYMPSILV